jgi:hypothetical protein
MSRFLTSLVGWLVAIVAQAAAVPGATTVDLASDTAWTASADGGEFRPIIVPGGGWNSDRQPAPRLRPLTRQEETKPDSPLAKLNRNQPDRPVVVKDQVVYRRDLAIPAAWAGQVIQLEFGGVNYGAEIWLDGKPIGGHVGPMMPFTIDLTGIAQAGKTHQLEVKAFTSRHYNVNGICPVPVGFDYEYWRSMHNAGWTSKTAYGIVKYVRLASLPPQHVREVLVQTSVTNGTFGFTATLANAGDRPVELELAATLASWNQAKWTYPTLPSRTVTVPAHGEAQVVVKGIKWELGPPSYWWPNLPFREDYQAQLHLLNLTLKKNGQAVADKTQRFGFVKHAEGPYYYTVNGVRVNGFSDATAEAQLSEFDGYAQLPAYQTAEACRETWKRFMRLGINSNRIHQATPTDLMLDTADETGFMLIPETGLRGCHNQGWDPVYLPQAVREMVLHARHHPSVVRYSLQNENHFKTEEWKALVDAATHVDATRPLVTEDNCVGYIMPLKPTRFEGTTGHAYAMTHYVDHPKPCRDIYGMGEIQWGNGLLPAYAVQIRDLRFNDVAYFAPWSWLNYWPNLLEGGNHAKHGWKLNNDPDRVDGLDGWNSPIIGFVQRSQHPYLVQDLGILADNPGAPKPLGQGRIEWPYQLPTVLAGKPAERKIEVFNGGLAGNQFTLAWSAHWDKPDGEIAVKGGEIPCKIEPGFHATQTIAFTVPKIETDERRLYLVLESRLAGKLVFRSEETCLNVVARQIEPAVTFLGGDDTSQGDWQGKFGADGDDLIGKETKLPAYARLQWQNADLWIYDPATNDKRALAYFANPPTGKDRIAAARYNGGGGDEVAFIIDVGAAARRLSLYFLDYDRKGRRQTLEIADAMTGQALDKREIADFANGRYLSWKVQGKVKITLHKLAGDNACVSGLFLDPAKN